MATSSPPSEGRLPMLSSEPAPSSPRPWASARARPLADDINVPRPLRAACQNRTFLLCLDMVIFVVIFVVSHFFRPERLRKVRKSTSVPPPCTGKPEFAALHLIFHIHLPLPSFNRFTSSPPSTPSPPTGRRFFAPLPRTAAAANGTPPTAASSTGRA